MSEAQWIKLAADAWGGLIVLATILTALVGLGAWRQQMHATSRFEAARDFAISLHSLHQSIVNLQLAIATGKEETVKARWKTMGEQRAAFMAAELKLRVLVGDVLSEEVAEVGVRIIEANASFIDYLATENPPPPSQSDYILAMKSRGLTDLTPRFEKALRPYLRPTTAIEELRSLFSAEPHRSEHKR